MSFLQMLKEAHERYPLLSAPAPRAIRLTDLGSGAIVSLSVDELNVRATPVRGSTDGNQ